ncbi:carbamoyltransferase HypF, partial [Candidatus Bipolaricaulota bacterium]|nr:carbamoyltransferase HypF [Candidatus Bipolaricaulota bacterium]
AGALAPGVAPGLHTVGAMLPYTGLHHLLFAKLDVPLVMTSANLPGRPMLIDNDEIVERLNGIADHFLLHDRRIAARCDDSVRRRVGGAMVFLRRSRGYVPGPIEVPFDVAVLALGPETDVTFAIADGGKATLSQHIGSVDDLETLSFLESAIEHLYRITHASDPVRIACDLHRAFSTTRLARELAARHGAEVVPVQHHVAHLCSVMAEHGAEKAVGIILDGYGYGWDGEAWGGEILVASDRVVSRAGSLMPVRLPGGDQAARHPLRMAAAFLHAAGIEAADVVRRLVARGMAAQEAEVLCAQIERGLNAPWTTSAGRFLDAVAAWLGICTERTYEGEPAMRLEAAAVRGTPLPIEPALREVDGRLVVDTASLFCELVQLAETHGMEDVAATAQHALAAGAGRMALIAAERAGVETIAFSGGVAYNDAIATSLRRLARAHGLILLSNERVPCGDGGVSFGQAVYAGCGYGVLEADRTDAASGG